MTSNPNNWRVFDMGRALDGPQFVLILRGPKDFLSPSTSDTPIYCRCLFDETARTNAVSDLPRRAPLPYRKIVL